MPVTDEAVYKRLGEQGAELMQRLCVQVSQWLYDWLAPHEDRTLAPKALEVLALDESKLDSMKLLSSRICEACLREIQLC